MKNLLCLIDLNREADFNLLEQLLLAIFFAPGRLAISTSLECLSESALQALPNGFTFRLLLLLVNVVSQFELLIHFFGFFIVNILALIRILTSDFRPIRFL